MKRWIVDYSLSLFEPEADVTTCDNEGSRRVLPPRLRATDGAAGGMTGNSWARAAESKYEQRRRAREDRGARPPRTVPAARASAAASSLPSLNPPPPRLPPLCQKASLSSVGAQEQSGARVPPKTPELKERRTITRRPDS